MGSIGCNVDHRAHGRWEHPSVSMFYALSTHSTASKQMTLREDYDLAPKGCMSARGAAGAVHARLFLFVTVANSIDRPEGPARLHHQRSVDPLGLLHGVAVEPCQCAASMLPSADSEWYQVEPAEFYRTGPGGAPPVKPADARPTTRTS